MATVEQWAHDNIEGADSDAIECVWDGPEMSIVINDETVQIEDYGTEPDSAEHRLSLEIDAVNYWYAYNN